MTTTFKVRYKPNPKYRGDYKGPDCPGIQGTFPTLEKAEAAVESCKRYFNTEKYLDEVAHPDGSVTQEQKINHHDNVIVWIDELVDGAPKEAEELAAV